MPKTFKIEKCVICDSGDLIPDAKLLDNYTMENINVHRDKDPNAVIFKGRARSATTVVVCGNCGHVYLFANDPDTLRLPDD